MVYGIILVHCGGLDNCMYCSSTIILTACRCMNYKNNHITIIIETWSDQPTTGDLPPPCDEFTFNQVDSTHAILYGGYEDCNDLSALLQGTFILDLRNWVS